MTTISSKQLLKTHNRRPAFRPQELNVDRNCPQAAAKTPELAGARGWAHMRAMNDIARTDALISEAVIPPQPRDYHGINWGGLQTLYLREVRRFMKVGMQTLLAPVVTALL